MNIKEELSPNFWKGRSKDNLKVIAFVIHLMRGTLKGTNSWFKNKNSFVSSGFGVGLNGDVVQYVDIKNSAWHCGVVKEPKWKLIIPNTNPNYYTIGIENEGYVNNVFTENQLKSNIEIIKFCLEKVDLVDIKVINRDTVISHNEICSYKEDMTGLCDRIVEEMKNENNKNILVSENDKKVAEAIKILQGYKYGIKM